jgi:hypothetical protein
MRRDQRTGGGDDLQARLADAARTLTVWPARAGATL